MFILHLALRTLRRLGVAVVVVPLVVLAIELLAGDLLLGLLPRYVIWSVILFPLVAGWVIADVFVELDASGERIGAESLGMSNTALRAAVLVPVMVVSCAAVWMASTRVPALVGAASSTTQPSRTATVASAHALRGVRWSQLSHVPGGAVERIRRMSEPLLGLVIGWLAIALTRVVSQRVEKRPRRAGALIGVMASGLGVYVFWSLGLHVLRSV